MYTLQNDYNILLNENTACDNACRSGSRGNIVRSMVDRSRRTERKTLSPQTRRILGNRLAPVASRRANYDATVLALRLLSSLSLLLFHTFYDVLYNNIYI